MPPKSVPANNAGMAGVFLMISAITKIGTKKSHPLMLNELEIADKSQINILISLMSQK